MAKDSDDQQQQLTAHGGGCHQVSGKTVVMVSLAGAATGGPLLAMMGVTFLAAVTLLLVRSPLLLIFSPLLFGAALILLAALAGFAAAAAMALVGISALLYTYRLVGLSRLMAGWLNAGSTLVTGKLMESAGA